MSLNDPEDSITFISAHRLRRSYGFSSLFDSTTVPAEFWRDVNPRGPYLLTRPPSVGMLVNEFQFLDVKTLKSLASRHSIKFSSSSTKDNLRHNIYNHKCTIMCPDDIYCFKALEKARLSVSKVPCLSAMEIEDRVISKSQFKEKSKDRRREQQKSRRFGKSNEDKESAKKKDNLARRLYRDSEKSQHNDVFDENTIFPSCSSDSRKADIIREWQQCLNMSYLRQCVCAACGQDTATGEIITVQSDQVKLSLLQNRCLPHAVLPKTYNLLAYDGAILHPNGLHDINKLGDIDLCRSCCQDLLDRGVQPLDSLANFQYYGIDELPAEVKNAFAHSTMFDILMVARSRATRITHLYSQKPNSSIWGTDPRNSQGYSKGNVAILPQDSVSLRRVVPPNKSEIERAMCALFTGGKTKPTRENIARLSPVLVSKTRIRTLIDFLLEENPWYIHSGMTFSSNNLADLFPSVEGDNEEGVPSGVDICHLSDPSTEADAGTIGYTDRHTLAEANDELDEDNLFMDAVGYVVGDDSPDSYHRMKAEALAWALDKKKFIRMQSGSMLLTDKDPGMLTYLFPNLDPWGIGGFYQSARTPAQHIPFERQVRNLLRQHNSPFQKDPSFAYVCWNIIQKREVNLHANFKASATHRDSIARDMVELAPDLTDLIVKWTADNQMKPTTTQEKKASRLLNRLKLITRDVKGSAGYKQCRRNEIRALIKTYGTPALFLTLNPSDLTHPLVGVYGGLEPSVWRAMSGNQRARFVAGNPGAAARFFDTMIRNFVDIVLRPGKSNRNPMLQGLFGPCETYYGMVETQGRGTLHCHMLVWLVGNPNPQDLRDRMAEDDNFRYRMFDWIESIVYCHLPGMTEVLIERGKPYPKPKRAEGEGDPRLCDPPIIKSMDSVKFQDEFKNFVNRLAVECNWHEHRDTCFIHLKPGEPKNDQHCRMRIDGSTRAMTELDSETQSILLKRLHPRINNFNDVVIFLMQCNMDIKYIGSGEAAKALVFYVTDYITKSTLSTHVGLGALIYAIKQNDNKYHNDSFTPQGTRNISLFAKTVNAMMARHETSHQMVMAYLIGGGDYYKNDSFRVLRWGDFDRMVRREMGERQWIGDVLETDIVDASENSTESPTHLYSNEETEERLADEAEETDMLRTEEIVVAIEDGRITTSSSILDYKLRSTDTDFEGMSLWQHTQYVVKTPKKREADRLEKNSHSHDHTENSAGPRKRGRRANARGEFSSDAHPQFETHVSRVRDVPFIPVILGPTIPRGDRGDDANEFWCRAMLILFKPWRSSLDLKAQFPTWKEAFTAYEFPNSAKKLMSNMNVEHECKDARDTYERQRRSTKGVKSLMGGLGDEIASCDLESLGVALHADQLLDSLNTPDNTYHAEEFTLTEIKEGSKPNELVTLIEHAGVYAEPCSDEDKGVSDKATPVLEGDRAMIRMHSELMGKLHAQKRPSNTAHDPIAEPSSRSEIHHRGSILPRVTLQEMESSMVVLDIPQRDDASPDPACELENVIRDLGILGNAEQERAVRIIGEHFILGKEAQLLMYVGGIAGSGKSYVVKAVVELFKRCGVSDSLLLSAPTGCAAVLIGGYTIHALTFLPASKFKPKQLELDRIWRMVKYLVIDEVSMIDGRLMSQISHRISSGKALNTAAGDLPFGGINVIFTGDMGQLTPVKAKALFSHELVKQIQPNVSQSVYGQGALHGAFLWRQISTVVELKKNFRAEQDPAFVNLLARVRNGITWDGISLMTEEQRGTGKNYDKSDVDVLMGRTVQRIKASASDESSVASFKDAPVVVRFKVNRDALNNRAVHSYAHHTNQSVHYYHSEDKYKRCLLKDDEQNRMWRVRSSITKDSLGLLPLVPGMKVMITDNIAIKANVVNGAEGILQSVKYETDSSGRRYAACAYVKIANSGLCAPGLEHDVVPILPSSSNFVYEADGLVYNISRKQLPMLPAYAFTDYKVQGRSLTKVIIDLFDSKSSQSAYVMLSRATQLSGVAIMRWFPPGKINKRLPQHFRDEFSRLQKLDGSTTEYFNRRQDVMQY